MRRRIGTIGLIAAVTAIVGLVALQPGAVAKSDKLHAKQMSGDQEVPGPGDADGSGHAQVWALDADTVCFKLHWNRIEAPTLAHIHTGASGVGGPPVVDLYVAGTPLPGHNFSGCVDGDAAVIADVFANPSAYYVNIHNDDFPAGALRAQLN